MDANLIHKALANPMRREMLAWLKDPDTYFPNRVHSEEEGVCAGQFDHKTGLSQSSISAHLASLQKAGLVTRRKVGQWIFYNRNEKTIAKFLASMNI